MDFLIHWPPGPVVATVQCQGLNMLVNIFAYLHVHIIHDCDEYDVRACNGIGPMAIKKNAN